MGSKLSEGIIKEVPVDQLGPYGKWLVKWFRKRPGSLDLREFRQMKVYLQDVLSDMRNDCHQKEKTDEQNRIAWRDRRIEIYNNLLLLALGAEGESMEKWFDPSTRKGTSEFDSSLVPGSIYTYLVDQIIHEDEEIMFRYYRVRTGSSKPTKWRKYAFWLVESIRAYRRHLSDHVIDALKEWDAKRKEDAQKEEAVRKEETVRKEEPSEGQKLLLNLAKDRFKAKVNALGRDWDKRSWRNRARLYWLLGLAKHAPIAPDGKLCKFKGFEYVGPICFLLQDMIEKDEEMLSEKAKDSIIPEILDYHKVKYYGKKSKKLVDAKYLDKYHGKKKKDLQLLGHLKICRLLAWATAADDPHLVMIVLQHHAESMKSDPDCDSWWEESWKESWCMALWNASFRGNAEIVEKLLKCNFPYHEEYSKYFSSNKAVSLVQVVSMEVASVDEASRETLVSESSVELASEDEAARKKLVSETSLEVASEDEAPGEKLVSEPSVEVALKDEASGEKLVSKLPAKDAGSREVESKGAALREVPLKVAASPKYVEPPLHVAVRLRHISVVNAFCTAASENFSCHEENASHETPLEVATKLKCELRNERAVQRKMQSSLLRRPEVKDAVDVADKQRELAVNSANAIMVGAVLIAGITFGGWLQPPLGYSSYYQFAESYMSIQGHRTILVFAIFNSLSFFFAIAAVVAGMETTSFIESIEDIYLARTVPRLRNRLKWTTTVFILSVLCVLIAFASAGIAILPPIDKYQRSMYITIAIGGFVCVVFICKMLLFSISKGVNKWTTRKTESVNKWTTQKTESVKKWAIRQIKRVKCQQVDNSESD